MPERAFAREARAAFDPGPDDAVAARERRRVLGAGGAVQRHHRAPDAGGDVHEARIVAHHDFGERKQVDRAREIGPPAQVGRASFARGGDLLADGAVLLGAEQPDGVALRGELARERGEMRGRPALGRTVLRARAEGDDGLRARKSESAESGG